MTMIRLLFFLLPVIILSACDSTSDQATRYQDPLALCAPRAFDALAEPVENLPLFGGLGAGTFPITTQSDEAQAYFDQGFKLTVAFNHMEAVRSFRYAIQQDSSCAMCYWGLAYALGPNYNAAFDPAVLEVVNGALANARKNMAGATPKEQALIRALALRYPDQVEENQIAYEEAYSEALRSLTRQYSEDLTIEALCIESLMNLHPWDLWGEDGSPKPWTSEILQRLEGTLERDSNHLAAIHFYIHATEASSPAYPGAYTPGRAKIYADRLPGLAPGAGHLVHMPSHTYLRTGDYLLGTLATEAAVRVDSTYVAACHAAGAYPLAYYPHNFHFLAACAALEGDSRTAIDASWRMAEKLDTAAMRQPGLETIQHYYSIPYYVLVKFARWDDILALPRPAKDLNYPTAIWRYARGMAFAALGQTARAEEEMADLKLLQQDQTIRQFSIWEINQVGELLDIAALVLEGTLAAAQGNLAAAEALLAQAVGIEDELNYNEPPDWFFSVRHHLGPVLLAQGRYAAAEQLFRRDLEKFPENGFALSGLQEALIRQGKEAEAAAMKRRFDDAWQYADVTLNASEVALR